MAVLIAVGIGQGQRARHHRPDRRPTPTRRCARRSSRSARPRRSRVDPKAQDRDARSRPPGEVVKAGTPVNIFYADPADAENKKKNAEKDKDKARTARPAAVAAAAAAAAAARRPRTSSSRRSARTTSTPTPRRSPTSASSRSSRKQFNDAPKPARCSRPSRPAARRSRQSRKVHAARLRRPAAGRLHQRQEHPARQRRQRRQARPGRRPSPDDEANPTWTADGEHVAYAADGRVMLKDLTKKNAAAVPLLAGRPRVRRPRVGADRRPNVIAMDDSATTTADGHGPLLRRRQARRDGRSSCIKRAVVRGHPRHRTGRRTGARSSASASRPRRATGIFGIVRWTVKKDKPAFSADPADWNKGRFVTDIDTPGQGRARRRGLARRQAARAGLQPGLVARSGCGWPTTRTTSRSRAPSRPPCAPARSTWRGDCKELLVVQGDARLRGGRGA